MLPPAEIKPNSFQSRQNYFLTNSGRDPSSYTRASKLHIASTVLLPLTLLASLSGTFLQILPAGTGYATEGALLTSAELSTDTVSDLRKVWC